MSARGPDSTAGRLAPARVNSVSRPLRYSMPSSSTSKISVAFGPMSGGEPIAP
jgi:hypothetical protein